MLISGGTGSGKTTLLNAMSGEIPDDERIVTIEDAAELRLNQSHVLRLEARPVNTEGEGLVTIRDLVRNALRMRPDRIVVGEVRGAEALDMLQAMNTGHDGSLSTVHANTARDALARVETMVLMAGYDLPVRAIRQQVASALDLIVHIGRLSDGSRRVTSITEVLRMEADVITTQDLFKFEFGDITANGNVLGELRWSGLRPTFTHKLEHSGARLPGRAEQRPRRRRRPEDRSPMTCVGSWRCSLAPVAADPGHGSRDARGAHRASGRGERRDVSGQALHPDASRAPRSAPGRCARRRERRRRSTGLRVVPASAKTSAVVVASTRAGRCAARRSRRPWPPHGASPPAARPGNGSAWCSSTTRRRWRSRRRRTRPGSARSSLRRPPSQRARASTTRPRWRCGFSGVRRRALRSVVVLSDGADAGSHVSPAEVVDARGRRRRASSGSAFARAAMTARR